MRRVIEDERLANIASAIREKTGTETTYTDEEMPAGVAEVYEAGKKAEYNEFWAAFYDPYGENNELFAGAGWNINTFYPQKDFGVGQECFRRHNVNRTPYDLVARLKECGVKFLKVHPNQSFSICYTSTLPVLDMSMYQSTRMDRTFMGAKFLESIELIKLGDNRTSDFNNTFSSCSKLEEIRFDGVIPNSISFSASPLSVASMKNIISCLKDFAGTSREYTYTLTFKSDRWTALDAEGATAPGGVTWREYVTIKGWNAN